ncbi:MAG TPA: trypsin-like peptidase domain-containing protein [Vicinamibacterales bacterium]|jgi:S1-C subfamily serine protease|nr:trypsin-like peptidase domain-containing protein [Vicinamibacterales bacterium]
MKVTLATAVALVLLGVPAAAQRAKSPADAAVFIRLSGSVHAETIDEVGFKRTVDLDHVEIGSGSGFVISPFGYVLTNDHVVNSTDQFLVTKGLQQARVTLKVSRVDVCFRPEVVAARALSSPCVEASVTASDPALDLAVLFVSGSNLPYIALGDSDVVTSGLAVDALGYPFGREVEVGKVATAPDLVPEISTTPGAISALRADDTGTRRYLQVTNTVNPGNSGGPLVTRDGFAVGVIRMRLTNAAGIGFAIPVNEVKDFLESHGLDQLIPARRLRLGSFQSIDAKGLGLRLPEGFADMSPYRARAETDGHAAGIALRIDRVVSPWSPRQLEGALVGTQTFEPLSMAARDNRVPPPSGAAPLLLGGALGTAVDPNQEVRMDYAVLDLGPEKLVARYVGPAEWMAFNESALRNSLTSLQGQRVVVGEPVAVDGLAWTSAPAAANGQTAVPVPAGWVVEPVGPSPCPGLPPPSAVAAASPPRDLTVVLRVAVWPARDVAPAAAALACASGRGSAGAASYTSRATWLGVSYVIEGVFASLGQNRVVQLEVLSTDQNSALARALLAAWLDKARQ